MTSITDLRRSTSRSSAERALEQGNGVLRLSPTWVPRSFCVPGRRIRLHPEDYFALGGNRGGIDERWLSSSVRADNGPLTGADEGLSFVVAPDREKLPFDEVVGHLGEELLGERLWREYGRWPMYSKFFDNRERLPLHVHHRGKHAAMVGRVQKPESYYFPPQMNNHLGKDPMSFFGLTPGTDRDEFAHRIERFGTGGDNRITELSPAYRIQLGTGWDMPAGVVHAPASICTYEPQSASDVFAMCESWTCNRSLPHDLLWKDVPPERHGDIAFIVELLDWEANVDPRFAQAHFMAPIPVADETDTHADLWIVYRSRAFCAKELTVKPGGTALVTDSEAYGCIAVQGHGTLGDWPLESPTLIRYGQLTFDEYFVSATAARRGVRIVNTSPSEPLVLLKHFGPDNPDNIHAE